MITIKKTLLNKIKKLILKRFFLTLMENSKYIEILTHLILFIIYNVYTIIIIYFYKLKIEIHDSSR